MKFKKGDLITLDKKYDNFYVSYFRFESSLIGKIDVVHSDYVTGKIINTKKVEKIGEVFGVSTSNIISLNEAIRKGFEL